MSSFQDYYLLQNYILRQQNSTWGWINGFLEKKEGFHIRRETENSSQYLVWNEDDQLMWSVAIVRGQYAIDETVKER